MDERQREENGGYDWTTGATAAFRSTDAATICGEHTMDDVLRYGACTDERCARWAGYRTGIAVRGRGGFTVPEWPRCGNVINENGLECSQERRSG